MGFLCCLNSKTDLTEPPTPAHETERRQRGPGLQYNVPEDVKYAEAPVKYDQPYRSSDGMGSSKQQSDLLAAPGPERSRDRTQMSSPQDAASDDDLRVSCKALTHTHTQCSSTVDERSEVIRGEGARERDARESRDRERAEQREREREAKQRERDERKSSASLSVSGGDEWRKWKDNPATDDYVVLSTLGRGAFADVVLGRHKQTHKHHALKVVYLNKPGLKDKHVAVLQREGTYLRKLQHKNIVRCLKVYQAPQQWVFVLEYLKGGMLLNDLAKLKRYSEKTAAAVFRQVLSAVAYLHENNIVHRDIKPENVVFKTSVSNSAAFGKDNIVKLVDFGMILDLSKEPHSRGMMGSPGFVAPEVILGQHHTSQMDCYSLGVLLFVMLVGVKPMTQDQARSMQYALMTPESLRGMHDPRWRSLTDAAKELILKLLQPDPKNRFTAKQALNHRWIKGAREDSILDGSVMDGWADHLQMLHPGYMGSPSPFGAGNFAASPQFGNVRGGGGALASGQPRPPSHRSNSGTTPSSAKRHGTPVSPLGVPITAPAQFPPIHLADGPRTPTRGMQSGTPPAAEGSQSHPFSWNAETGNSVPLHSPQFADAAHKAVHDEVLKRAQEKLAQAQQFYMTAQIMRQAEGSGLLHSPLAGGGLAPQSPSKPISGTLQTDGSEATQWARTQEHSLSAVAQSYMSTQNNSGGTGGNSAPHVPPGGRVKSSADFDATLKDARNLMNELNKAPSLPGRSEATYPSSHGYSRRSQHASPKYSGAAPGSGSRSRGHRSKTSAPLSPRQPGSARAARSPHRPTSLRSREGAQSHNIGLGRPSSKHGGMPRRPSSRRAAHSHGVEPRSILEMQIQDPARDAYYGAADDESAELPLRPASKGQRRPTSMRSYGNSGGPRPRSKGGPRSIGQDRHPVEGGRGGASVGQELLV